jgi:hypothetical protein
MNNLKTKFLVVLWILIIALSFAALITMNHLLTLALAICFFIFGLYLFCQFLQSLYISLRAKGWKQIQFKIINPEISMQQRSGTSAGMNYLTSFEIEYEFERNIYTLPDIDLDIFNQRTYFTIHKAQAHIDRIKNGLYGSRIYINPINPNIVIIKPGLRLEHLKTLLFSLLFCIPSTLGGILVLMLNGYV